MTTKEFNLAIRKYNIEYRNLFGYIPTIDQYSCTREEFMSALKYATENIVEIAEILNKYASNSEGICET